MKAEAVGRWPENVAFVSIVLLAKPGGGYRPIGLFPTFVRLWMKLRRDMVEKWEADNSRPYFYAGRQRGAHVAAWSQCARAEAASLGGASFAQLLLDLAKCFELVPHDILVREAAMVGYPPPLLRMSLAAYSLPRSLAVNGVFSSMVVAQRGITAGSGTATTELRVLLMRLLDRVAGLYPQLRLNVYVDDMSAEATGTQESVVAVTAAAGRLLCSGLIDLRLKLSEGKCKCSATSAHIGHKLASTLADFGVNYSARVKGLGVGMASGARRNVQVQTARLAAFCKRLGKLATLARSRISAARIFRTGGSASFTYGDDVTGVSDDALLRRRRMVATAVTPPTGGRDLDLALLLADSHERQRLDPAFEACALPIARWSEAVYMKWCPIQLLRKSIIQARARVLCSNRPWAVVHGPAAATVATARRIAWEIRDGTTFVTDQGRVLDLEVDPPAVVRLEVYAAVSRWRLRKIAASLPHVDRQTIPVHGFGVTNRPAQRVTQLAMAPIRKLLTVAARTKHWTAAHQGALWSAVANTQWPQVRLFSANKVELPDCQLCAAAGIVHDGANPNALLAEPPRGTLWHRLTACRPTVLGLAATAPAVISAFMWIRDRLRIHSELPPDDPIPAQSPQPLDVPTRPTQDTDATETCPPIWGPPRNRPPSWHAEIKQRDRRDAITECADEAAWKRACSMAAATRAIVPLPHVTPPEIPADGTHTWHGGQPDTAITATFYTDGSLIDADLDGCERLGWAFVALDSHGCEIAAASGVPPPWINSISGAEAWALLMAARAAAPGSVYVTDSLNCVDTLRRGKSWALGPNRPLARIWRQLFTMFDSPCDQGPKMTTVTWMPAHTSVASIGTALKSDDTVLTASDHRGNAAADTLAKEAAHGIRAPVNVRAEIDATMRVTYHIAQYLGHATFAANHHPLPPHRDSAPTSREPRSATLPRPPRRKPARTDDRTVALGGHDLFRCGRIWSCKVCWATSRQRHTMAQARCTGPATARWAERERQLRIAGFQDGPLHARIMTDGIIWCMKCGHYATRFAVGLAKPCSGAPLSDGSRACRNHLAEFRHPRTRQPLAQPHFPESTQTRRLMAGPYGIGAWGNRMDQSVWAASPCPTPSPPPPPLPIPPVTLTIDTVATTQPSDDLRMRSPRKRLRLRGKQPQPAHIPYTALVADVTDRASDRHSASDTPASVTDTLGGTIPADGALASPACSSALAPPRAIADSGPACTSVANFGESDVGKRHRCTDCCAPLLGIASNGPQNCIAHAVGMGMGLHSHRAVPLRCTTSPPLFPVRKRPHGEVQRAALLQQLRGCASMSSRVADLGVDGPLPPRGTKRARHAP